MKTLKVFMSATVFTQVVLTTIVMAQRGSGPPRKPPLAPPAAGRPDGPQDAPRPPKGRPEGGLDFASIEMLGGGRVVPANPYTADAVIESTQVLRDGTAISRKSTTAVARDSEGRLRRERRLDAIAPFLGPDDMRTLIVIDDPVLNVHYVFDVENKVARKIRNPAPRPPLPNGGDEMRGEFAEGEVVSLGTKSIEGIQAEGTRSTITIPVGKIGNDRAIEIVSERWFSPVLQVVLMSKHSDPRMGETVYRLINIKRNEPDASLFKVPADYTIREGKPPHPPGPGGRGPGMRPGGPPPPPDGRGPNGGPSGAPPPPGVGEFE